MARWCSRGTYRRYSSFRLPTTSALFWPRQQPEYRYRGSRSRPSSTRTGRWRPSSRCRRIPHCTGTDSGRTNLLGCWWPGDSRSLRRASTTRWLDTARTASSRRGSRRSMSCTARRPRWSLRDRTQLASRTASTCGTGSARWLPPANTRPPASSVAAWHSGSSCPPRKPRLRPSRGGSTGPRRTCRSPWLPLQSRIYPPRNGRTPQPRSPRSRWSRSPRHRARTSSRYQRLWRWSTSPPSSSCRSYITATRQHVHRAGHLGQAHIP